jgi:ankyrin repeat protein
VNSLLTQLSSQRDKKQKGSTPLHLAASLEGWPDALVLCTLFPPVRLLSRSATALLLDANLSTAYQADDEGGYPIHVAAHAGSLDVVKLLLERCPDCATIRDGKGRTFLHVTVEEKCYVVVRYVVWGGIIMPQ